MGKGKAKGKSFGKSIDFFFVKSGWSPWVSTSQMRSQCCDQVQSTWLISGIIIDHDKSEKKLEPYWIAALSIRVSIFPNGHGPPFILAAGLSRRSRANPGRSRWLSKKWENDLNPLINHHSPHENCHKVMGLLLMLLDSIAMFIHFHTRETPLIPRHAKSDGDVRLHVSTLNSLLAHPQHRWSLMVTAKLSQDTQAVTWTPELPTVPPG